MFFGANTNLLFRGIKRGPVSSKRQPNGWYKGRNVKSVGTHTNTG